jgi:hypothetical protein
MPDSSKRALVENESEAEEVYSEESEGKFVGIKSYNHGPDNASSKRRRRASVSSPPQYLLLHHVTCQGGGNHSLHKSESYYLDVPRLFAQDSKANVLRGKEEMSMVEEYLEDHPEVTFIVYKSYSCHVYHELVRDDFDRMKMPRIDPSMVSRVKAYFFSLPADGKVAEPNSEAIGIVSEDLTEAIEDAKAISPDRLLGLGSSGTLKSPYIQIYHARDTIAEIMSTSNSALSSNAREHLSLLLNFVTLSCSHEWQTADTLFQDGLTNATHFYKLFRPGDIVVTSDAPPVAYLLNGWPSRTKIGQMELSCTTWTFNQAFSKRNIDVPVVWPSGAGTIPITTLDVYPLRYDASGLAERLKKRGKQFWACRRRAFVGYSSLTTAFDLQKVSNSNREM